MRVSEIARRGVIRNGARVVDGPVSAWARKRVGPWAGRGVVAGGVDLKNCRVAVSRVRGNGNGNGRGIRRRVAGGY